MEAVQAADALLDENRRLKEELGEARQFDAVFRCVFLRLVYYVLEVKLSIFYSFKFQI